MSCDVCKAIEGEHVNGLKRSQGVTRADTYVAIAVYMTVPIEEPDPERTGAWRYKNLCDYHQEMLDNYRVEK